MEGEEGLMDGAGLTNEIRGIRHLAGALRLAIAGAVSREFPVRREDETFWALTIVVDEIAERLETVQVELEQREGRT